jgi:hypothetical protein
MTDHGALDRIAENSMITADGDEAIVMKALDGKFETIETGTTTADDEAQVVGKATEAGT